MENNQNTASISKLEQIAASTEPSFRDALAKELTVADITTKAAVRRAMRYGGHAAITIGALAAQAGVNYERRGSCWYDFVEREIKEAQAAC